MLDEQESKADPRESQKEGFMKTERQNGTLSGRVRYVARLIGQGLLTLLLIIFEVVKSGTGGGYSSSSITPVVLPASESHSASRLPDRKTAKRRRQAKGRTN